MICSMICSRCEVVGILSCFFRSTDSTYCKRVRLHSGSVEFSESSPPAAQSHQACFSFLFMRKLKPSYYKNCHSNFKCIVPRNSAAFHPEIVLKVSPHVLFHVTPPPLGFGRAAPNERPDRTPITVTPTDPKRGCSSDEL